MKIIIFFIMFTSLLSADALAQSYEDKIMQECIKKSTTHADLINCASDNEKRWDNKLNYNYSLLYNVLPPTGKQKLKESQTAWLKYRDLEFKFISDIPYPQDWTIEGNMWIEIHIEERADIIKHRVLELADHYKAIKSHKD